MSAATHTPGYEVTQDGRVFSTGTNWRGYGRREMQQDLNDGGYPSVRILLNGKRKRMAVHRLVAMHYLPPRPSPHHEIRHLDGNKLNPHATNLAWGTKRDNAADRERHGRTYHMTTTEARAKAMRSAEARRQRTALNV